LRSGPVTKDGEITARMSANCVWKFLPLIAPRQNRLPSHLLAYRNRVYHDHGVFQQIKPLLLHVAMRQKYERDCTLLRSKFFARKHDVLVCTKCGHRQEVTADWLRLIGSRHCNGATLGTLTERTLSRLICSICQHTIVDVYPHDAPISMLGKEILKPVDCIKSSRSTTNFDAVSLKWTYVPRVKGEQCPACMGTGGKRQVCLKCRGWGEISRRNIPD
jgi:hypothetical protein